MISRRIGVKEAAKRFKVALSTLEDWIEKSSKYCENLKEEDFDMEDQEDLSWEEDDDMSIREIEEKQIKSKGKVAATKRKIKVDSQKLYKKVEKFDNELIECKQVEKCKTCNKSLETDESMMEHIVSRHLDNVGNCEVCGEETDDVVEHFADHLEKKVNEVENDEDNISKATKTSEEISEVYVKDLLQDLLVDV